MPNETDFEEDEYLYRGILEVFWDFENDRPTSAIFKDSKGEWKSNHYRRKGTEASDRYHAGV